ncbi:putative hydroxymethylpyrimidine transport system substrate-binding protein [Afifella marina DSM 2698]|uniref:Putative hydroxymethylpyrimidine transport system substrate-binding protein n=2 Tax=Afifella marina TaxID=1080 RepID=A0A1G5P6G6_AFIMA|nr:ABC transporter substrate-binding protein [Afifella marina]SCZ44600.1 putative hydroxymethylpyrimidine transport system substrate-binding protein [Afifella marina DSM 2698]
MLDRLRPALLALILSASPAAAADHLTVLLDWFVNPDHAPLVVAQEKGYFAEEDLDVEMIPPADPSAPPRLVAAGEGDVAISYQPNLYLQIAEGLPLARFGTLVETPLNSLVVLEDSDVTTLADLKGKTVGFSVGGFEDVLLKMMLEESGVSLDDVDLVNVNFALSPALLADRVDAVIGAFRNVELNQLDIEGKPGRAFYPEEHGVPPYDELIFIARSDKLDDDRLPRFLKAIEHATLYLTNHPEEALEIFTKAHPDLGDELNRRAFMDTVARFSKSPGAFDAGRYQRFAEFMKDQGLIETVPELESYAQAVR